MGECARLLTAPADGHARTRPAACDARKAPEELMCDHHMGAHEFLRSPQPPGPPCTDMPEMHKKWQWQVRARAAWPHTDLVTRVHTLK